MSDNFVSTWWGKAWLEALHKIDYSDQIESGLEKAKKGDVDSINIDMTDVHSLVIEKDRNTPFEVHISFSELSDFEMEEIYEKIDSNHYYISRLESNKLPPKLKEELDAEMINIFPTSFRKIDMDCSCSEEKYPCKHISAVFYLIAGEIDKNPFLIFTLRGFDIYQFVDQKDSEEQVATIPTVKDFLGPECLTHPQDDQVVYESLDFSKIPNQLDNIKKLLTPEPLFYQKGDFKKEFLKAYDKLSSKLNGFLRRKRKEIDENPEDIYNEIEINIKNNSFDFIGKLRGEEKNLFFNLEEMDEFVDYLHSHSLADVSIHSPTIAYLSQVYNYTLMILQRDAYIPEIFNITEDEYMIRWLPALYEENIRQIHKKLTKKLPQDIITYKNQHIKHEEQVNFLISFIISHFQRRFDICPKRDKTGLLYLFFFFEVYTELHFEDRNIAETIHLWLSQFYIQDKHYKIIVKIEESPRRGDQFYLQILIKTEQEQQPIALQKYLSKKPPEKNRVLKDLSLLSNYLPQINEFLQLEDQKKLSINSDSFVDVWFEALPIVHTLGVETILPAALQEVHTPSVSLDFEVDESYDGSSVSYMDLKSLLDFNYNIALGDKFLDKEDFQELVDNYSGIVKYEDSYVYIDDENTEELMEQLEDEPELTKNEILQIGLSEEYNSNKIKADDTLDTLFENLFSRRNPELPKTLQGDLREYQVRGYKWLYNNHKAGLGSLIADDMGLGKTIQVITLLLKLKEEGQLTNNHILIVVPASLLTNWHHEFQKFGPALNINIYHGQERSLELDSKEVIITTYSLARKEKEKLHGTRWLIIISDETQKIKNPSSRRTKALKSLRSKTQIAMTGTPVENRLMDYWSIFDFIMNNFLGQKSSFKNNFAIPIERYGDQDKLHKFRSVTNPFIIRREKTDESITEELPEKIEVEEYTSLKEKQAALYQKVIDETEEKIKSAEGNERNGHIFSLLTSLKQICNHPAQYLKEDKADISSSGKSELLFELLDKILERNEKSLLFTQYVQMGDLLVEMLQKKYGFEPLFLHGSLSRNQRDKLINKFQNNSRYKVLILSLRAGGVGLNLTAANHVIHYDLWWNPAVENQATDRAYRIGQDKDVTVYRLLTEGTFEERINDILNRKKELAEKTVQTGEKWINDLSNEDLHELVKLNT